MQTALASPAFRALQLLGLEASNEERLSATEAAWLSGYFAALARDESQRNVFASALAARGGTIAAPAPASERVRVLYATETGNAARLARETAERLSALGLTADVLDLAECSARTLEQERTVIVITSTHGDGTPPERAARFFESLSGPAAPKSLAKLRFAVLGLGDSSYEHFCRAAKLMDERLSALGAQRLLPRVECDVDYRAAATRFCDELCGLLRPTEGAARAALATAVVESANQGSTRAVHDRQHPFSALVLENTGLTGRGSSKEVRHLALSLEDSGLSFSPGDALGVCAPNHASLVDELLTAVGLSADTPVALGDTTLPLGRALRERFDVTVPSPRFLEMWAEVSGADELARLQGNEDERRRFLRAHHILDLVSRYPGAAPSAEAFVRLLRPLAPRLYSIASSPAAAPGEVHLTVAVVRYQQHQRTCLGVASGHIAERAPEGEHLEVFVHDNPAFRLPQDDSTPILMIGPGTGVAPYRGFVQERAARGARGGSWLFFGERNFRTDFLYQTDWQAWLKKGALTKLSLAFSRDQAEKVYVQDRIREHGREVFAWLEEGAHVYVCGDAKAMAPAVHEALLEVITRERGTRERALEYLQALRDGHRYQRDVY